MQTEHDNIQILKFGSENGERDDLNVLIKGRIGTILNKGQFGTTYLTELQML